MKSSPAICILHIEDDPLDSELIAALLEANGMSQEIIRVDSEDTFVAALRAHTVDLIISDFNMPAYHGHRALLVTRMLKPEIPFIFFTAALGEDAAVECLKAGATDFVTKQRPQRLASAVQRALQEQEERTKWQASESERLQEMHFRVAIEHSMTSGVAATDLSGRQTYINPGFSRMVGWSAEELLGATPPFDYWPPEEIPAISDAMNATLRGEAPPGGFKLTFCHRNGSRIHVLVTVTPLRDFKNNAMGWLAVVHDISDQIQAEQSLKETNLRLEKALADVNRAQSEMIKQERMNALAQMVSGIAHDFNNTLMPLMGLPEYLLNQPGALDEREELIEMLKAMLTAASDARDIVRRLREFYRPGESIEVKPFVISDLVIRVISLTEPFWKAQSEAEGRTVIVETSFSDVPKILGHEASLREMLTNMMINASHAIPSVGTIRVSTSQVGDFALLCISDTGTGMTEEVKRRCFEPFFSTKGESGTGLGLAMCYGIVQRHGGTITLESEVGRGTTFTIRLPIQGPADAQVLSTASVPATKIARSLHVLTIDDSSTARSLVKRYLKADGHTVETADSGTAGLELLRKGGIDLVITDRAMPEMSGDELAMEAKRIVPGIPVIMLSGFGDLMNTKAEKPEGVDAVIAKPVTNEELNAAIAKVLGIQ